MKCRLTTTRRGFAYVAVLFLLGIVTMLGLSFLFRRSSAAASLNDGYDQAQATYLAQAALSEAKWRLINDCSFPPIAGQYTMRDLGGGRYGYEVQRHAGDKYATIAAIGSFNGALAREHSVMRLLFSFAPRLFMNYAAGTSIPQFSSDACQGTWLDRQPTASVGDSTQHWMEVAAGPTRRELLMTTQNNNNALHATVWTDEGWSDATQIATGVDKAYHAADVAYETLSGRALVVARTSAITANYNVWDGTNWLFNGSSLAFIPPLLTTLGNIVMKSDPFSDEILIGSADTGFIQLYRWNGSSFSQLSNAGGSTLSTTPASAASQCMDICYEHLSGDAIIVWGRNSSGSCQYVVWNGTTLSAVATLPGLDSAVSWVRMTSRTGSDQILMLAGTAAGGLWILRWNGSSWSDNRKLETNLAVKDVQNFDVAWETLGTEAIAVWGSGTADTKRLRQFRWTQNTLFSTGVISSGPTMSGDPSQIRLIPDPQSEQIHALVGMKNKQLNALTWNGNGFTSTTGRNWNTTLPTDKFMPFDLALQPIGAAAS
jgi:hypothetical protein